MTRWTLRSVFCLLSAVTGMAAAQQKSTFITAKEHRKVTIETFGTDTSLPALILLHGSDGPGGGYFQDRAKFFAASGYQVIYPHYYDAAPDRSQSLDDFEDWVDLVRELAGTFAPGRKFYLLGFSQGAEIALGAGAEGVPATAIADWYGAFFEQYARNLRALPPLLVLHGARDTTIPPSFAAQTLETCREHRLRCESHIYPDQGHGFGGPDLADADRRTVDFFREVSGK